ncbi:fibrinogen-like protein 1-like protein [Alligator mississippiensis]|uniref:Fibrinogen-like protein 1-like protein n=1 Tax=Alligator mississippiensis TaxID=8496 RepID=A0A151M183_ALLMI|nr:fibrinogen-like protein 1-like protein [Alligator mississippiensis]
MGSKVSEMKLYPFLCFCFAFTLIKAAQRETLTKKEVFGNITNRLMIKDREHEVLNIPEGYTYPDFVAKDCRAAYRHGKRQSGLYVIRPKNSPFLAVYCEMDDGGWTVLQRHSAGENEKWSQPWSEYKNGFGNLRGDHWLGNEMMHLLTRQNVFIVRFVFVDSDGHTKHADYHTFKVDSEENGYALRLGDYSGDAGDALTTVGEAVPKNSSPKMSFLNMPLAVFAVFLLICTSSSAEETVEEVWKARLRDVDNLELVENVTAIRNLNDVLSREAYHLVFKRDCEELFQIGHTTSGLYIIRPEGSRKLVVQCYMDGCNGWTVIQRNSHNTEITWTEAWTTYKYGFGNLENDHWLGNEYIHLITKQKLYKVRIDLTNVNGVVRYAEYDSFFLADEDDFYKLKLGMYEGTAGDSLSSSVTKNMHDNMRFSAKDRDNDRSSHKNCADVHGGGWWFDSCYDVQLNRKGGLHWQTFCDSNCKSSVILLKPVHMYCHRV